MSAMVVGVRFKRATKIYYFSPGSETQLKVGDDVIVETSRGREMGRVVIGPQEVDDQQVVGDLKPVERRATPADHLMALRYQRQEAEALRRCREMVAERGLPMKVVSAEYNCDGSRLVFAFAAEKRVDFRELVRELAKAFKARIELRQIGVRDEAKLLGGLGTCGRELCCCAWLPEFAPVSIKMAKHQDLPLSPMEISGQCGRLLCCLGYEDAYYQNIKASLPKVGSTIMTRQGPGRVTHVSALKEVVTVQLESEAVIHLTAEELRVAAGSPGAALPDEDDGLDALNGDSD
ncbi:MAG: PSP1 domain-containing protein [Anaerolineae bacterium]